MTATVFYRHFHTIAQAGDFLTGRWQGSLQTYDRSSHAVPVVDYELCGRFDHGRIILEAGLKGAVGEVAGNDFPHRWILGPEPGHSGEARPSWALIIGRGDQLPRRAPKKGPALKDDSLTASAGTVSNGHRLETGIPNGTGRSSNGNGTSNGHTGNGAAHNQTPSGRNSGVLDVAADNLGGTGDGRIDWNIYALTDDQIYLCAFDSSGGKRTVMLLGNLNRRRRRFWPAALHFIDSRRRT